MPPSTPGLLSSSDHQPARAAPEPAPADDAPEPGAPHPAASRSAGTRLQTLLSRASDPLLLSVAAILWATPAPAMRFLFLREGPPSASVVTTLQCLAAGLFMLGAGRLLSRRGATSDPVPPAAARGDAAHAVLAAAADSPPPSTAVALPAGSAAAVAVALAPAVPDRGPVERLRATLRWALAAETSDVRLAGLELGFIAAVANALVALGYQYTPATRGSLLTRTSVVFTALLAAAAGERLRLVVWAGVALACAGGALVSADGASLAAGSATLLGGGDALIVLGAFLWGVHTVRMGRHAPRFPALQLATLQLLAMAGFSALWLARDVAAATAAGLPALSVWPGWRDPTSWTVLVVSAVVSWGIASGMQVNAQSRVSASQTQIIYGTIPLWTLLIARQLGSSDERLGLLGWVGGAALLSAVVATSLGGPRAQADER